MRALINRLQDVFRPAPKEGMVEICGEKDWDIPAFFMDPCAGRDQVVNAVQAGGWKSFEAPMPQYFAAAVKQAQKGLVVDVGANTGFYSLLSLCVSRRIKVCAYEPLPPVFNILQENISQNGFSKRVTLSPFAVSNSNAVSTLYVPDAGHGLVETSASLNAEFKEHIGSHQSVTVRKLDDLHPAGSHVAIMKVDAEGHDLDVLHGAEALMQRDRPIVFVEVLLGANETGLTDVLQRCGYQDIVLFPNGASQPGNRVVHETLAWNHMWVPQEKAIPTVQL
ncbi:FkbM family methyltransferase [Acetobacter pomorum]|uniref:FkbM family methyltransferase n=1 Tax=Acetobacter pomorum TaxID=65959 RepID=UPI00142D3DF5|nr:FkbM family methyltransferase [Acetobacter pomorum]